MSKRSYDPRLGQIKNMANLVEDWEIANQIRLGYYNLEEPIKDESRPGFNTTVMLNAIPWKTRKGRRVLYYKRISILDYNSVNLTGSREVPLYAEGLTDVESDEEILYRIILGYLHIPREFIRLTQVEKTGNIYRYKLGFNVTYGNYYCFVDDGDIDVYQRSSLKFNLGNLQDDLDGFLIPTYEKEKTIIRLDGLNREALTVIELLPPDSNWVDLPEVKEYETDTELRLLPWNIDDGILNNLIAEYSSYPYTLIVEEIDGVINHSRIDDIIIKDLSNTGYGNFHIENAITNSSAVMSDIVIKDSRRSLSVNTGDSLTNTMATLSDLVLRDVAKSTGVIEFDGSLNPTLARISDIIIDSKGITYRETKSDSISPKKVTLSDIILSDSEE